MAFKAHMVIWAQIGEGFRTVCGIDDGSSDQFQENAEMCDFGDESRTTCKKCLAAFKKMLTKHDLQVASLSVPEELQALRSPAHSLISGR